MSTPAYSNYHYHYLAASTKPNANPHTSSLN